MDHQITSKGAVLREVHAVCAFDCGWLPAIFTDCLKSCRNSLTNESNLLLRAILEDGRDQKAIEASLAI